MTRKLADDDRWCSFSGGGRLMRSASPNVIDTERARVSCKTRMAAI